VKTERITLPDGATTIIEWFDPEAEPRATLGFLPALGANVEYYRPLAALLSARGYRVACVENRGGEQSSVRPGRKHNFGYQQVLEDDLALIVPQLQQRAGAKPFLLTGHSLGGQFALLYASQHPSRVDGVVLLAGGSNYYGSLAPALQRRRRLQLGLARLITQVCGFFPGDRLGFGGRQPRDLMLDWTCEALTGEYRVIGADLEFEWSLPELARPVLFVSLDGDELVPASCARYLASKLAQAKVSLVELPAAGRKPHFRWVKTPAAVVEQFERWFDDDFSGTQSQPRPAATITSAAMDRAGSLGSRA